MNRSPSTTRVRMPEPYQIDSPETRDRVMRFLNEIGIPVLYEIGATGFSEGCSIRRGALYVDPTCRVSTMLHESGHLAITPRCFRSLMDGNLFAGQREMLRIVADACLHPDEPFYRAVIQCSDPEATAWAWAAGAELGLPGEEIIRDDEYGNDGDSVRLALQLRSYIGVHGLAHAGFCAIRNRPGVTGWPHLHFWTQETPFPERMSSEAGC
ncbi:hypothetical protein [Burkholderia sp. Ac-20365]|uniref:hypothetical protein n=1 Tax=Burkholderia sp. Ac-20365 TaxID=2703897 RepID=UPI00197B1395|nr:hypothetical protein [Burkholderia sp. Ac-20365]MBN3761209.1 hypothetical protein [Burkholderia sp. Ac-20365]